MTRISEPPQKLVVTNSVGNISFKIPAGAENHRVTACRTLKRETTIYALLPHMHLRGKSFEYRLTYPSGETETILSVPHYSFSWQLSYYLDQPKRLPAGTFVECTAYFDNSANNPANPDPSKEITFGEQSWDEMMIGFFDVAFDAKMPLKNLFPEKKDEKKAGGD